MVNANDLALRTGHLVQCLAHVQRLGEPAAIHPCNHVADFKPGVLDANGHAVLRARPGEDQQVPARFEHSQAFGPDVNTGYVIVPLFAHKGQAIRRVGHDGIDAVVFHEQHVIEAVAVKNIHLSDLAFGIVGDVVSLGVHRLATL